MLRGHSNAGFVKRLVGIHERAKEVLASSDHYYFAATGCIGGLCTGFGYCTIYLYLVLTLSQVKRVFYIINKCGIAPGLIHNAPKL